MREGPEIQRGYIGGGRKHSRALHFLRRGSDRVLSSRNTGNVAQVRNGDGVQFWIRREVFFLHREPSCCARIGFHPLRSFEQRAGRSGGSLSVFFEEFSVRDSGAAVLVLVRCVFRLIRDVLHLALGQQESADWFGVRNGIDLAFLEREAKFARRVYTPLHIL